MRGRCADTEEVLARAFEHAKQTGTQRERSQILDMRARAIVMGPTPVEDAVLLCLDLRRRAGDDVVAVAMIDTLLAVLEAMRSRIDEARSLYLASREQLNALGLSFRLAGLQMFTAIVELVAGEPRLAEAELQQAYGVLERAGELGRLPTIAAFLARVLYAQGRLDEAERYTRIVEDTASDRDICSQILWRGTRSRLLARSGSGRQAEQLAREGVRLARRTDLLLIHADAASDLADVLTACNRPEAALHSLDEAIGLHRSKNNQASAEAAAEVRDALASGVVTR
jgi:ATP/maltotriose-dependent transcriptional regulator MalT